MLKVQVMRARALSLSILLLGTAGLLAYLYEPRLPMADPPHVSASAPTKPIAPAASAKTLPAGWQAGEIQPVPLHGGKLKSETVLPLPPSVINHTPAKTTTTPESPQVLGIPSSTPPSVENTATNRATAFKITPPTIRPESVSVQPAQEAPDAASPKHESSTSVQVFRSVTSTNKEIAITFDDGPHPTFTFKVLDELRARNIKATFFVLGNRVKQYPWIVQQIANEGHEIGNHTYSHRLLTAMPSEVIEREITETQNLIKQATGHEPSLFRPPFGAFRPSAKEIFQKHNLSVILWSVDPRDWKVHDEDRIYRSVTNHVRSGSIVLCHDIHLATLHALPRILDTLLAEGYQFTTVSQLCGLPSHQPKLATAVRQP